MMAVSEDTDAKELNATAASLLGFLAAGPQSGYALAAHIENTIGNFWNVTRSQIYRELRTLEAAGLIRVGKTGTRDRRPYTVTALGRRAFEDWIAQFAGDENIRMPLLLTVFFGNRMPKETLAHLLRDSRKRHTERLAVFQRQFVEAEHSHPFPAKTARFGTMYEEMVLAWFDSLESDGLM